MVCRFQYAPYRRPLAVPLRTARRVWYEREGIVIRLEATDGRIGYGEVAPVDGFGSETLEEAVDYLNSLSSTIEPEIFPGIPERLGCCRFALASAWWQLEVPDVLYSFRNTALLPTGESAVEALVQYLARGFLSFKMKIGVASVREELADVQALLSLMPGEGRLRLDANGVLDEAGFRLWLDALDGHRGVEFIEQPMGAGAERIMQSLAAGREMAVALDESLVSIDGIRAALVQVRWTGPLVLKSSLLGFPADVIAAVSGSQNSLVFSSVFETGIGLHNGLRLASAAGAWMPVGYGTLSYFADDLNLLPAAPHLDSTSVTPEGLEHLWQTICAEFAKA